MHDRMLAVKSDQSCRRKSINCHCYHYPKRFVKRSLFLCPGSIISYYPFFLKANYIQILQILSQLIFLFVSLVCSCSCKKNLLWVHQSAWRKAIVLVLAHLSVLCRDMPFSAREDFSHCSALCVTLSISTHPG